MSTFACTPGSTEGFKATDTAETDATDIADTELYDTCISESILRAEASELDNAMSPELHTDSSLKTAESTDFDAVGRVVVDMDGGVVDVAAGVALLVEGGGVDEALGLGLVVEGGRELLLLLNVVLKSLATELASDKMLLQIAAYEESSENGTMLQTPPVVVVVVAVIEQPFAIEHVMSPQLVVRVVPGVAVFVMFHVEHGCVQTDTDDEEHELDVAEELSVPDVVPDADLGLGLSLIQNGPTQFGLGRHDPTQLGGGTGGIEGGCNYCQYNVVEEFLIALLEERAIHRRNNLQLEECRDQRTCRRKGSRALCCSLGHISTRGISIPSRHFHLHRQAE